MKIKIVKSENIVNFMQKYKKLLIVELLLREGMGWSILLYYEVETRTANFL